MYGIVLATALTTGTTAADFGFMRNRCSGCRSCYSYCGCSGCYGCYGCSGCYGGWSAHGGCRGCWTTCGCYGCYGYCGGWGCSTCSACYGGACYAPAMMAPAYGCAHGCAGMVHHHPAPAMTPATGVIIEGGMMEGVEASATQPATVVVKADPAVEIKVNGQITARRFAEESYQSPALVPGRSYTYTVVASLTREGKTISQTKEITVQAGRRSEVDFTSLGTATTETESASVTVVLPEGARLTVNDVVVTATGKQTFQTPKLEKGKSYFYTVKAELNRDGRTVTDTRRVDVTAGKAVTIDFTTSSSVLTASR